MRLSSILNAGGQRVFKDLIGLYKALGVFTGRAAPCFQGQAQVLVALAFGRCARNELEVRLCVQVVNLSSAAGKDTEGFVEADQTFKNALATSIEYAAQAHFESGRTNKAKVLTNSLARYLNDTIPLYAILYPAPEPKALTDMPTAAALQVFDRSEEAKTKFIVPALTPKRKDVLAYAKTFEGAPYKWGGENTAGFDCSGFVLHVFQEFGYDFYHNSREIARLGEVVPLNRMKPGDIACFGYQQSNGNPYVSHVGIVASANGNDTKVIHAVNTGVQTDSIAEGSYWNDRLLFVRDVMTTDNTPNRSMYGPR